MATENSNQGLASLFAKIATISGKIGAIQKDATHAQNYKYHSADAIMGALNHLMSEHGLVIIPTAPRVATENERYVIQYEFVLCDAETGETFAAKWAGEAPLGIQRKDGTISIDDKAMGKAHTYALKYWLLKLFMISTVDTDDLDTNDNSHTSKPASKPSPKRDIDDIDAALGTTPPNLSDEQRFILDLIEIIKPICKHENHARNAINGAIEEGAIAKGDSLDKAAGIMLLRRMKSQWGLTEDESKSILPEALGMPMKDYLKANPRDYEGIWEVLTARYAEMPE